MKKYNVIWAPEALDDLEEVILYISQERPLTAKNLKEKIHLSARSLMNFPKRGRNIPELGHLKNFDYREIMIYPWRLMYQIFHEEIYVVAFLDGRREATDFIYERMMNQIKAAKHS